MQNEDDFHKYLSTKFIAIIGASSGIGSEAAHRLVERGFSVLLGLRYFKITVRKISHFLRLNKMRPIPVSFFCRPNMIFLLTRHGMLACMGLLTLVFRNRAIDGHRVSSYHQ